jgi:hypothetical protein
VLAVTSKELILLLLITANMIPSSNSFQPDDGGNTFFRNFASYKSHMRHIPEAGILLSHRGENLKLYTLSALLNGVELLVKILTGRRISDRTSVKLLKEH